MRRWTTLGGLMLGVALSGCGDGNAARLEANRALVQRFADAGNAGDWVTLETILTEDFTRHSAATPGPPVTTREAFISLQQSFATTFPDQRVTIEDMVAEGDRVAVRATYAGTQTGPMGDFPATGGSVSSPFLGMFRIEDGRIAELWVEWDNVAILTQLGLFPPAGAPAN